MKKPMLMLLILLLVTAVTLALIARREPAVQPALAVVTTTPTEDLTTEPTAEPTEAPTAEPTAEPTATPTEAPTTEPTAEPTAEPTEAPTAETTAEPTAEPTEAPTAVPTPEAVGGEMSVTVRGYQSDVTVGITVDADGVITAMTVEAGEESPGLGRKCAEARWTEQFIGKHAPFALAGEAEEGMNAIDAVSYATITSRTVVEAVNTLMGAE